MGNIARARAAIAGEHSVGAKYNIQTLATWVRETMDYNLCCRYLSTSSTWEQSNAVARLGVMQSVVYRENSSNGCRHCVKTVTRFVL